MSDSIPLHSNGSALRALVAIFLGLSLAACGGSSDTSVLTNAPKDATAQDSQQLSQILEAAGIEKTSLILPDSKDFAAIPSDPQNPITAEKVVLGQMLFHDSAFGLAGKRAESSQTYGCASCHHAQAGFKSGIAQGIGEGGAGFGLAGELRSMDAAFSMTKDEGAMSPDVQPIASPSVLNSAYQELMLWNGQFGNGIGSPNQDVAIERLATEGTPKAENNRGLAGIETQAVAGTGVHRMKFDDESPLILNDEYKSMFEAAFPNSTDKLEDASKAIAAFERTLLANEAPFQRWLRGDENAMTGEQLAGASLFFGKADCVACHQGPALSSKVNASNDEMFFALGFADLDSNNNVFEGEIDDATRLGRGGFTGLESDNYRFKIPQLYNLADSAFLGHGASFNSVKDVIAYKNAALAQNEKAQAFLDARFLPLGLDEQEVDQLNAFVTEALYDPNLSRYVPQKVPSGLCFPVNDAQSRIDIGCEK